jgi:hypothetical protein
MSAAVSPAKLRRAQRRAHLLAAAGLLAYVYAPLETELRDVVRFAVFPALALTGIAMWQAPRIRRISRRSRRSPRGAIDHTRNKRKDWTDATPRAR